MFFRNCGNAEGGSLVFRWVELVWVEDDVESWQKDEKEKGQACAGVVGKRCCVI